MKTEFHQQQVWPLAIRVIHWVLALTLTALIVTGWMMGSGMVLNPDLHDTLRNSVHIPSGQVMTAALAGRLLLLAVVPGVSGWRSLMPTSANRAARGEMFRFYLSFGRREIPGFYAHDPLWALIYPLLFLALAVAAFTGFGLSSQGFRHLIGLSLDGALHWHGSIAVLLVWITGLHVASVLLREIRGKGYEVSSMFHGYRLFARDRGGIVDPRSGTSVSVPIDQLGGTRKKGVER